MLPKPLGNFGLFCYSVLLLSRLGKTGSGQYDYENDILYVAKGTDRKAVIHEIVHIAENKLVDPQKY